MSLSVFTRALSVAPVLLALSAPSQAAETIRVLTDYDARGQVLRSSQPHRLGEIIRWAEHRYDSLDRKIRLIHPDGKSVATQYGPGEVFSTAETHDELGHRRESQFDAFGNELHRDRLEDGTRLRTSYSYDALGRVTDIVDGKGSTFWYAYDGHGNKVFDVDPDLGCRETDYDLGGRVMRQRTKTGALVSYTNDALGRVLTKAAEKDALQFTDCRHEIVQGTKTATGSGANDVVDAGNGRLSKVVLNGGAGNDTYLIQARSGYVTIPVDAEGPTGGMDTVHFLDLSLRDLEISKVDDPQNGSMLVLSWDKRGTAGSLKIAAEGTHIERFEFADGSTVSKIAFSSHDRLRFEGTSGDDLIIGSDKDDQIFGGLGNDVIDVGAAASFWQHARGQSGDDTYLVGSEAGQIWISRESETSGTDTLRFKDLVLADLTIDTFDFDGEGEVLRFSWTGNGRSGELRLADRGQHIEQFEFADGTVLSKIGFTTHDRLHLEGTAGGEMIIGSAKDDLIYGGGGNDIIDVGSAASFWQHARGEEGDDIYLIGSEAGKVWINRNAEGSGTDIVRFKDLVLSDLSLDTFDFEGEGKLLRFSWVKNGRSSELRLADLGQHVERFEFADGSSLRKIGFSSHDRSRLEGTDGDDLIIGSDKDDQIFGGPGNDIIDVAGAATFWQHARGQGGDDTYLIGAEAGKVWIARLSETSGTDTIRFKDLSLSDITLDTFDFDGEGEVLRFSWAVNGQSGELRLADLGQHVERIEFADGGAVRRVSVTPLGQVQLFAADPDGSNWMLGSSKDDYLFGSMHNDLLDPGAGTGVYMQHLRGEAGNDTYQIGRAAGLVHINYLEGEGDGTDTVRFKDLLLGDLGVSVFDYTSANLGHPAGVQLRLSWNTGDESGQLRIDNLGNHIERFEFADGTVRTAQELWP